MAAQTHIVRDEKRELYLLHRIWHDQKKPLSWWRRETGYPVKESLRKRFDIPILSPSTVFQISVLYAVHLDFVAKRCTRKCILQQIEGYQNQVLYSLETSLKKHGFVPSGSRPLPW